MKDWLRNIFKDKKGMGTVEVILIFKHSGAGTGFYCGSCGIGHYF